MNNEETSKEEQNRGIRYVAKQSNGKWQSVRVMGKRVASNYIRRGFSEVSEEEFERLLAIKRAAYTK